jgi:protein phosphatase 1L
MLPTHPTSGYCDIQGRRRSIEDFHTVHLNPDMQHQFYGVFDGHLGNLASKYAASSFYQKIEECLSDVDQRIMSSQSNWKEDAKMKLIQSFEELHDGIINAVISSPAGGIMDESGTTATILYVTDLAVLIANVGDSRAILSQWSVDEKGNEHLTSFQLTVDHIASSKEERMQILERGGHISESGGIDRVNGILAVSRSLGDVKLAPYLSRTPHVFAVTKEEAFKQCGKVQSAEEEVLPCFIILASDGLWDVMSNQEAVDLAWQVMKGSKGGTAFQEAAEVLTQEAYVRGSSDNIGVCVVAIT